MNHDEEEYPDLPEIPLVPPSTKERWAIAKSVFGLFNWIIGGSVTGGLMVIAISMWTTKGNVDLTVKLVKDAIIPLLEWAKTFAATVFFPLVLACIGYYFGAAGKNRT